MKATATPASSRKPAASSPVVTFQGAASRNGIGRTVYAGIAFGVVVVIGAGML